LPAAGFFMYGCALHTRRNFAQTIAREDESMAKNSRRQNKRKYESGPQKKKAAKRGVHMGKGMGVVPSEENNPPDA